MTRSGSLRVRPVFVWFRGFRGQNFSGVLEPRNTRTTRKGFPDPRVSGAASSGSLPSMSIRGIRGFKSGTLEPRISPMTTDGMDHDKKWESSCLTCFRVVSCVSWAEFFRGF